MTSLGLLLSNALNFTYERFSNLSKNFPLSLNLTAQSYNYFLLFSKIFNQFYQNLKSITFTDISIAL